MQKEVVMMKTINDTTPTKVRRVMMELTWITNDVVVFLCMCVCVCVCACVCACVYVCACVCACVCVCV